MNSNIDLIKNAKLWRLGQVSDETILHAYDSYANYCPQCGKKLPLDKDTGDESLVFLENAIKYALKVDKKAKPGYGNSGGGEFCS